uniref:AlNc14C191G8458 protein n=1 Tax=Albugo laibachii Nc14 TaxID=890382 RepID=F0WPY0_9STRA|nr:AlNc14C191G8458 [Albugo laibachii Nc14]|eukprot:CCA23381.1 AlNc14C191G8458 [Albugo laibachii Nc14]
MSSFVRQKPRIRHIVLHVECLALYRKYHRIICEKVYVDVSLDVALEQNAAREDRFDADIIEAIAQRFKVPNKRNRWDRPLSHIKPSQIDEKDIDALDSISFESILYAIQMEIVSKPDLRRKLHRELP